MSKNFTALARNPDHYQKEAFSTAMYPGRGTGTILALAYVALGLGEAGELQGKIKKLLRGDKDPHDANVRAAMIAELGDLQWYVAAMATEFGIQLSEVMELNLRKLDARKRLGTLQGDGDER